MYIQYIMFTKIKYFFKIKLSKLNLYFLPNIDISIYLLYDVNKYRNLCIYITIIFFITRKKFYILYLIFHFLICKL